MKINGEKATWLTKMKNWFCILIALMLGVFSASAIPRNPATWNSSRLTGYGWARGYRPPALGSSGASLGQASAWHGRWLDITLNYTIGMRPYAPVSGSWLTFDPAWNELDPSGTSYCGGDPINGDDPDGMFSRDFYQTGKQQATGVVGWADDFAINSVVGTFAAGNQGFSLAAKALNMDPSNFDWQASKWQSYMSPYARAGYYNDNNPGVQLATFSAILVNPELALSKLGSLGRTGIALESETALWRVGRHGDMPSPRPTGYESHHGVNSVWMEENVAGYSASDAPAVLMKNDPFHNATRGVFNQIRNEIAARQGVSPRNIDWSKVSPGTAWRIAEEQLQAAKVPANIQEEYFRQFNQYLESLR